MYEFHCQDTDNFLFWSQAESRRGVGGHVLGRFPYYGLLGFITLSGKLPTQEPREVVWLEKEQRTKDDQIYWGHLYQNEFHYQEAPSELVWIEKYHHTENNSGIWNQLLY